MLTCAGAYNDQPHPIGGCEPDSPEDYCARPPTPLRGPDTVAANRPRRPRSIDGDLQDFDAVSSAMVGVTAAYFCYPISPGGLLQATAFFAQAACEAGVHSIVNMSQISARREATSNAARQHWIAE
jgi:uncharacterized protein YbjT (DUF2867 family)